MSVELIHAVMGVLFCGVWLLVGQIIVSDQV